jgi:acyl-homoserine lactone acylase PvdQ
VGFGDAWILVVDFSRPATAFSVLAYGQTTNQESPHSSDQLRLFASHRLRRAWFSEADIQANLERAYRP